MLVTVINKSESVIYNGKIYKYGEAFEADDLIAKSLADRGYVREVIYAEPANEVEKAEAEMQTGYLDKTDLQEMPYCDLKRLAAQMGLDATGKKADLIARISAEEVTVEEESEVEETDGELPNTGMPE